MSLARRNLIERFLNKIKQCRRVATRYDKLAANYPAFVKLASIHIWLRAKMIKARLKQADLTSSPIRARFPRCNGDFLKSAGSNPCP
jgi:hypothetical protein